MCCFHAGATAPSWNLEVDTIVHLEVIMANQVKNYYNAGYSIGSPMESKNFSLAVQKLAEQNGAAKALNAGVTDNKVLNIVNKVAGWVSKAVGIGGAIYRGLSYIAPMLMLAEARRTHPNVDDAQLKLLLKVDFSLRAAGFFPHCPLMSPMPCDLLKKSGEEHIFDYYVKRSRAVNLVIKDDYEDLSKSQLIGLVHRK